MVIRTPSPADSGRAGSRRRWVQTRSPAGTYCWLAPGLRCLTGPLLQCIQNGILRCVSLPSSPACFPLLLTSANLDAVYVKPETQTSSVSPRSPHLSVSSPPSPVHCHFSTHSGDARPTHATLRSLPPLQKGPRCCLRSYLLMSHSLHPTHTGVLSIFIRISLYSSEQVTYSHHSKLKSQKGVQWSITCPRGPFPQPASLLRGIWCFHSLCVFF